jgi:hypothetical protein
MKDFGFGQVTPRIVDLLHRTKTWTLAISLVAFLGVAAFMAAGVAARILVEGPSPFLLILGLAGFPALAAFLWAVPLYRFAQAVDRMTPWNRGPGVASALRQQASFWRRAGVTVAAFLVFAAGGWLALLWLARTDPVLADLVEVARDPQGFVQKVEERRQELIRQEQESSRGKSPLVLSPVRPYRAPLWIPEPNPPAAPGRRFTYEEIGEACQVADTTFLCLINFPGERVGAGSRRVVTGDDAIFLILPETVGFREVLQVTLTGNDDRPWRLRLGPQMGFPLMKASYVRTAANTGGPEPYLDFYTPAFYCRDNEGRFRVAELVWGADGLPDRLLVDFELECDSNRRIAGRLSLQAG